MYTAQYLLHYAHALCPNQGIYSSRKVCMGLALAAFIACNPTVSQAMSIATLPAPAKNHHSSPILNAKLLARLKLTGSLQVRQSGWRLLQAL